MERTLPREFSIPQDLHLVARLQLNSADKFRAYFDESESLAKSILEADQLYMRESRNPVRPEALDRMKRIAFVIRRMCEAGRKALRKKNKTETQVCANKILHLRVELFSEPDREHGALLARNQSEGGKARSQHYKVKRKKWLRLAEEIRRQYPRWNNTQIAKKIQRETGDKFSTIWRTIGKSLKSDVKTAEE